MCCASSNNKQRDCSCNSLSTLLVHMHDGDIVGVEPAPSGSDGTRRPSQHAVGETRQLAGERRHVNQGRAEA
jgi:hypothetical protein